MNKLSPAKRAKILSLLVESMAIRAVARTENVSITAIARLVSLAGEACGKYHHENVHSIRGKRHIQCDELWAFVYAKEKRAKEVEPWDAAGNVWTFTALDASSKLIISYTASKKRSTGAATWVFADLVARLEKEPRLYTDELKAYRKAAQNIFGRRWKKVLTQIRKGEESEHNTAYVERHNLTIRMGNRRYSRKTNAFSKKLINHISMLQLFILYYNFCRVHLSLGVTPAMAAGLTDTVKDCRWIVELIDAIEPKPKKPGPAVGTKYESRKKATKKAAFKKGSKKKRL